MNNTFCARQIYYEKTLFKSFFKNRIIIIVVVRVCGIVASL